jgi:hypothetical protein
MPKYEFAGWEPCPWAPDTALIGYIEGLEIEIQLTRTPYHGHLWLVRGYDPNARSRFPEILESGYCLKVEVAQTRGYNAARRIATPVLVQQRIVRQRAAEGERRRKKARAEKEREERARTLDTVTVTEDT